jgi:predicted Fe-Mo cluster-binding NifX family protein
MKMKVAISAEGPSLDSRIDPRFGRCPFILAVDTETLEVEAIENAGRAAPGGAGIQAAELLTGRAVSHLLTGSCGPNAQTALKAAGIAIVSGCSGTAREALERFKTGEWARSDRPPAAPSSDPRPFSPEGAAREPNRAAGSGRGTGRGVAGGGRGMGGGGGRGMGGGSGRGRGLGRGTGRGGGRP